MSKTLEETLFDAHIRRLENDIAEREGRMPHLTEVDLKNIASLREGRVPRYNDHGLDLTHDAPMAEFRDLSDLTSEDFANEWLRSNL